MTSDTRELLHDVEQARYWFDLGDEGEVFVTYRDTIPNDPDQPPIRILDYSYVSPRLRGQGLAGELVGAVFEELIAEQLPARPTCSYMTSVALTRSEWKSYFLS